MNAADNPYPSRLPSFLKTGSRSFHRRAFSHDYFAPFIYHLILKKSETCLPFGSVVGDAGIAPGKPGCARICESELGKIIAKCILHLPYQYPILKIYQYCVMPDHVHILLQVMFRSDKHLDFYVESLRRMISSRISAVRGCMVADDEIFQRGYCDKPLYENRSLEALFKYIRDNPHRLAMRRQYPRFFQRVRSLNIGGASFAAYRNLFLFRNPDKCRVQISRRSSREEKENQKKKWLDAAMRKSVLVSPFISQAEKEIRTVSESLGASIILIVHETFAERFKPANHDFELCSQGRLLIISLGLPAKTPLTRELCLRMNALAQEISTVG